MSTKTKKKLLSTDSFDFTQDKWRHYSDFTLVVGTMALHVHKIILAVHSDFFHTLFTSSFADASKREMTISDDILDDNETTVASFQRVIRSMYNRSLGEDFDATSIIPVMLIAEFLEMPALKQQIIQYTTQACQDDSRFAIQFLKEAVKHQHERLCLACRTQLTEGTFNSNSEGLERVFEIVLTTISSNFSECYKHLREEFTRMPLCIALVIITGQSTTTLSNDFQLAALLGESICDADKEDLELLAVKYHSVREKLDLCGLTLHSALALIEHAIQVGDMNFAGKCAKCISTCINCCRDSDWKRLSAAAFYFVITALQTENTPEKYRITQHMIAEYMNQSSNPEEDTSDVMSVRELITRTTSTSHFDEQLTSPDIITTAVTAAKNQLSTSPSLVVLKHPLTGSRKYFEFEIRGSILNADGFRIGAFDDSVKTEISNNCHWLLGCDHYSWGLSAAGTVYHNNEAVANLIVDRRITSPKKRKNSASGEATADWLEKGDKIGVVVHTDTNCICFYKNGIKLIAPFEWSMKGKEGNIRIALSLSVPTESVVLTKAIEF